MPQIVQCPACAQPYEIDDDMVGEVFICDCQQAYEVAADLSLVTIQLRQAGAPSARQSRPERTRSAAAPRKKKQGQPRVFLWIFMIFGLGAVVTAGVMIFQVNKNQVAEKKAEAARLAAARAAITAKPSSPGGKMKLILTLTGDQVTDVAASITIETPEPVVDSSGTDWQVRPDPSPASWTLAGDLVPTNFPTASRILLPKRSSPFVVALQPGEEVAEIFQFTLFDLSKGTVVKSVETPVSVYLQREDCAVSPDGKWVAREESRESLKGIRIWDAATATPVHRFPDVSEGAGVLFQEFSDAEHLVVVYGSNPRKVRRTNVAKQSEVNVFETAQLSARDARAKQVFAISPGGTYLAILTRGVRGLVSIYHLETGELVGKLKTGEGRKECTPEGLAFSDTGTSLAALTRKDGGDYFITGWNIESGQLNAEAGPIASGELDLPENVAPLLWLRDSSGWVVSGRLVLDRAGQVLQTLEAVKTERRDYRVADGNRLIRFSHEAPSLRIVEIQ
jgi:hypothetical protein